MASSGGVTVVTVAVEPLLPPGWTRRRRDDADELDVMVAIESPERRDTERAAAEEDGGTGRDVARADRSRQGARRLADLRVVLVPLADGHQLVHRVEVVDVELAVEVVELMLERAPEEPDPATLIFWPCRFWATTQTRSLRVT